MALKGVKWEKNEIAKSVEIGMFTSVLVREFERVLLIKNGKIQEVIPAGKHKISKFKIGKEITAIYVSLKPFKIPYGLPETMSKDNVSVGCYGEIEFQVSNPKMFYSQVMGDTEVYTIEELKEYMLAEIQGVLRSVLAKRDIKEIYLERDELIPVFRTKLEEFFASLGMDFKRIEIQGVNIPESVKAELESLKISRIRRRGKREEVELELEKRRRKGEIDVEKYVKLAQAGIDVTKFKEAEIAEMDPEVLKKKYGSEAYKEALKMAKSQDVNLTVAMGMQQLKQKNRCPKCGHKIKKGAKFCDECGFKL